MSVKLTKKGEQFVGFNEGDSIHSGCVCYHRRNLAACNRRIVVAEDVGGKAPWNLTLLGMMLVVGAENAGVSKEVLDAADEIVNYQCLASFHHTTFKLQSVH